MMNKKEMVQERVSAPATELEAIHLLVTAEDKMMYIRRNRMFMNSNMTIEAAVEYH